MYISNTNFLVADKELQGWRTNWILQGKQLSFYFLVIVLWHLLLLLNYNFFVANNLRKLSLNWDLVDMYCMRLNYCLQAE